MSKGSAGLLDHIDKLYVINLAHRKDRLSEVSGQLARLGLGFDNPKIERFDAVAPQDKGDFRTIGARGCFLSHLRILRDARDRGFSTIFILEDDADFTREFVDFFTDTGVIMTEGLWDILYFGYDSGGVTLPVLPEDPRFQVVPSELHLGTSHAMMFRRSAIEPLVPYLEAMLSRRLGDPLGGPMDVDGAYGWFRESHVAIRTLGSGRQWAVQRSSRTDVSPLTWKEYLPFIQFLRKLQNRFRNG